MSTSMHRLQISLPKYQVRYLIRRAEQEGVSMAEIIRRLIRREVEAKAVEGAVESFCEIAGIAEDHGPLIDGVPVSERPNLYIHGGRGVNRKKSEV